jgi:acyl-CoA synthetase (AMP-forming)/AMP-acid ligase II
MREKSPVAQDYTFTISYVPADTSSALMELSTGALLRAAAAEAPEQIALAEAVPAGAVSLSGSARTDREWTYAQLLAEAETCAHWLLTRFAPGERIAVWAPNIPEWVILQYGAALAGLILVTANPALRAGELAYVLRQSGAAGVFYVESFRGTDMRGILESICDELPGLRERHCFGDWDASVRAFTGRGELPEVAAGAAAQIQYTSGTTGLPKGALLHHRGMINNAKFFLERLTFPKFGVFVSPMPLFHTSGSAMSVLGCAVARATYVLCQFFDPELVLRQVQDRRGVSLSGVPTMLIAIAGHPRFAEFDLSSCRFIVSGGSTVPSELVRELEARLEARFCIVFGQTETSPVITQTSPYDSVEDKALTIGRALPQVEVKIIDTVTGATLPVGEQGELCARGYLLMIGYYDMPEKTAAAIDAEGWLHTGDLATMDSRGFFTVTGRLKDMIIRGGENIYPREIEEVLFAHPEVADVAVLGVPDAVWGEQVAAVLRLKNPDRPPSAAALHEYCRARLAAFKTPRSWYCTEAFPLTGSGKVQKFRIAEMVGAGAYLALD